MQMMSKVNNCLQGSPVPLLDLLPLDRVFEDRM